MYKQRVEVVVLISFDEALSALERMATNEPHRVTVSQRIRFRSLATLPIFMDRPADDGAAVAGLDAAKS